MGLLVNDGDSLTSVITMVNSFVYVRDPSDTITSMLYDSFVS